MLNRWKKFLPATRREPASALCECINRARAHDDRYEKTLLGHFFPNQKCVLKLGITKIVPTHHICANKTERSDTIGL